jgi:hypothetical protein
MGAASIHREHRLLHCIPYLRLTRSSCQGLMKSACVQRAMDSWILPISPPQPVFIIPAGNQAGQDGILALPPALPVGISVVCIHALNLT